MAISTYDELKTAIADFLNRDDLTAIIPTFIALAESQFQRDIRHWKMETRASGQVSGGDQYLQVPLDWVETLRLHLTSLGTQNVQFTTIADISDRREHQ